MHGLKDVKALLLHQICYIDFYNITKALLVSMDIRG